MYFHTLLYSLKTLDLFLLEHLAQPELIPVTTVMTPSYLPICRPIHLSMLDLGRSFSFLIQYTVGKTPWTGDHSVARPLPTHRKTHTDIHALSGIRTHDPSVRASKDSLCLRRRGNCDRRLLVYVNETSPSAAYPRVHNNLSSSI
jgi:hypothetical protein